MIDELVAQITLGLCNGSGYSLLISYGNSSCAMLAERPEFRPLLAIPIKLFVRAY
jgi:hypothetical protein